MSDIRESLVALLNHPDHAPMSTHDPRDGSCQSCPWPLHEMPPEDIADAILAEFDVTPRGERVKLRAEVERLRVVSAAQPYETERELAVALDEARRELADLRAGIEALRDKAARLGLDEAAEDANTLLAGSGEQPGECPECGDVMCRCGTDWTAPVSSDSADVRERVRDVFVNAERRESFGGTDIDALTDAVLAVVGQSVTDCNCGFGGQHDPANPRCRANRATVRPSGQEGL